MPVCRHFNSRHFRAGALVWIAALFYLDAAVSSHGDTIGHSWREAELIVRFRTESDPHFVESSAGADVALRLPPLLQQFHKTNAIATVKPLLPHFKAPFVSPGIYLFRFADKHLDVAAACRSFSSDKSIEYVEPNYLLYPLFTPNDPYFASDGSWGQSYGDQWGLKISHLTTAWDLATATNEVVVAVLDSGVDFTHTDLAANIWTNRVEIAGNSVDDDSNGFIDDVAGWNFAYQNANPTDDSGHGTICAGIIAAGLNNGWGIAGIGTHLKIMPIKFLPNTGGGSTADAVSGIYYAANNGARVINMSFGGPGSLTLEAAVNYASAHGVVLIAAAGNDASVNLQYPAAYRNVITVGATDHADHLADFSNYGARIDIVAPGGDSGGAGIGDSILSLRAAGTTLGAPLNALYTRSRGTSFSAPFVAGVVGLMLTQRPSLQNEEIRQILRTTADDVMDSGWDLQTTYGRVNAFAALQENSALAALITSPTNLNFIGGTLTVQGSSYGTGFNYYIVEYGSGQIPTVWTSIASNNVQVANGNLVIWNTTNVSDGTYSIRLRSVDVAGKNFEDRVVINVSNFDPPIHPGWPQSLAANAGAPIAADLDGDGKQEILWGTQGAMVVKRENGSDFPGWPQTMQYLGPTGPPSVADLDGNGSPEIAIISNDFNQRLGQISIWHRDGTQVTGWPKNFISGNPSASTELSPVFADIDGDGHIEVIWCSNTSQFGGSAVIHVDRYDGTSMPGWPVTLPSGRGSVFSTPAVGDVDGDGFLDIAVTTVNNYVYLFHHNGTNFSGWPLILGTGGSLSGNPAFADVDHDGQLEIFAEMYDGSVAIYKATGQLLAGWPKKLGSIPRSPAFGDLDEDGRLEVAFGSQAGLLYVFHSDGTSLPGWPQTSSSRIYSPAILDLDHDGHLDLMTVDGNANVYGWDSTGNALYALGFPITLNGSGGGYSPIVAGDIDGDGLLNFSVFGNGSNYMFDLSSYLDPSQIPYPTLMGDNAHQSRYRTIPKLFSVSPGYLSTNQISQLMIEGDFFLKGMKVFLGTNQIPVVSETVTSIVANVISNLPPGWYNLRVYNVNSSSGVLSNAVDVISSVDGDDDGDLLPNGWEIAHGLDPHDDGSINLDNGAMGDPDHDGFKNMQELIAGTDPRDPDSNFKIVKAEQLAGHIVLSWLSVTGKHYLVYRSTNLISGFSVLTNDLLATPPMNSFTNNAIFDSTSSFYRIGVQ